MFLENCKKRCEEAKKSGDWEAFQENQMRTQSEPLPGHNNNNTQIVTSNNNVINRKAELASSLNKNHISARSLLLENAKVECPSCLDDFKLSENEMTCLSCGHFYCNDCFDRYLVLQIKEGGGKSILNCPALGCRFEVDHITILSILKDKSLYDRWSTFVVNTYVKENILVKWCPTEGCDRAISSSDPRGMVRCSGCGVLWCFSCQGDGHW